MRTIRILKSIYLLGPEKNQIKFIQSARSPEEQLYLKTPNNEQAEGYNNFLILTYIAGIPSLPVISNVGTFEYFFCTVIVRIILFIVFLRVQYRRAGVNIL